MAWWRKKKQGPAGEAEVVTRALESGGDRVLAAASDSITGRVVVAALHDLLTVTRDAEIISRRRWLEVDAGSWEDSTGTISVTWVDGSRGTQWTFGADQYRFAEAFRDRVEASRVVDAPVMDGDRSLGRAAVRKDLRTGELVPQLMVDRRVRRDDVEARRMGEEVLAELREQVGI